MKEQAPIDGFTIPEPPRAAEFVKAPGQFDRLAEEMRRYTGLQTFEGAKVEIQKMVTPNFFLNHSCWLGSSPSYAGANSHYRVGCTVADNDNVVLASMDGQGMLETQVFSQSGKSVNTKLVLTFPFDGKNDMWFVDAESTRDSCCGAAKLGRNLGGLPGWYVGASYLQAVSPRLALGGEGLFNVSIPSAQLTFGARYSAPNYSAACTYIKDAPSPQGPIDALQANYHRKVVPGRVNLASELLLYPQTGDSQVNFGSEFQLKQSKVSTTIDGSGKMSTVLEAKIMPSITATCSAELQFDAKDQMSGKTSDVYRFGYGLQVGGN